MQFDHVYKTLEANICHQYVDGEDEGFRYIFFSNNTDNNNNNN